MIYSTPSLGPSLPAAVLEKLTNDLQYDPLVQPALLRHEITASPQSQATTAAARFASARILAGQDDRIIVVVGPCSIHSPEQAIEYAHLLRSKLSTWTNLHIVMRAYLYVIQYTFLSTSLTGSSLTQ
jgi:phospho-2-dehydro-3-deoxyheptonate aldolase